jgi:hypothetical protein
MPIVTIQITREGTTPEQKAALIKGATDLLPVPATRRARATRSRQESQLATIRDRGAPIIAGTLDTRSSNSIQGRSGAFMGEFAGHRFLANSLSANCGTAPSCDGYRIKPRTVKRRGTTTAVSSSSRSISHAAAASIGSKLTSPNTSTPACVSADKNVVSGPAFPSVVCVCSSSWAGGGFGGAGVSRGGRSGGFDGAGNVS